MSTAFRLCNEILEYVFDHVRSSSFSDMLASNAVSAFLCPLNFINVIRFEKRKRNE